jgi:lysophospholipase L1-like esterase
MRYVHLKSFGSLQLPRYALEMKTFLVIAALALTLSNAHALAKKPVRIMPYGDSLTAGAFIINGVFNTGAGYRFTLWKLLHNGGETTHFVGSLQDGPQDFVERNHEGHSGRRIDEIAAFEHQWVTQARPDVVLLLIGNNDCIQNYDMPNAVNRLANLVEMIQTDAPKAHIFISTATQHSDPQVMSRIISYNHDITQWATFKAKVDPKIHFVDMFTNAHLRNGADGGPTDLIDGVHPTPEGYAAMAEVWYQALSSTILK